MKDNGMHERESLEHFKRIVPRNPRDWYGCVVLYSTWNDSFFNVAFGTGDNLDGDDMDQGFDDYIMVEQYAPNDEVRMSDIINHAKNVGRIDDETPGLQEIDGGQWLLKHKDWGNGDIRRFLMEALQFAGYGVPKDVKEGMFMDVIYIGADYDVWHKGKTARRKGASHEAVDRKVG